MFSIYLDQVSQIGGSFQEAIYLDFTVVIIHQKGISTIFIEFLLTLEFECILPSFTDCDITIM